MRAFLFMLIYISIIIIYIQRMNILDKIYEDNKLKAIIIILCLFSVWTAYSFMSVELYSDDDLGHYLISRYALHHPKLLIDIWGRPLCTIFYIPGSLFGLVGARLASAIIGALTCYLLYLYAEKRGYERAWLIPLLMGLSPRFSSMCYTIDTAMIVCLFLAAALLFYSYDKIALAALTISLTPAGRLECILFVFIFSGVLAYRKQWKYIPLAFAGAFLWNAAGFMVSGDPFWLVTSNPYSVTYGKGEFLHYFERLPEIVGGVHLPLFIVGVFAAFRNWRKEENLFLLLSWFLLFFFYVAVWYLGMVASVGLTRYFNTVAPVVCLLSLAGINRLLSTSLEGLDIAAITASFLVTLALWISGSAYQGLLVATTVAVVLVKAWGCYFKSTKAATVLISTGLASLLAFNVYTVSFPGLTAEHMLVKEAADWYKTNSPGTYLLSSNAWFGYFLDIDPYDATKVAAVNLVNLQKAPAGTVIVWEPHYAGGGRYGKTPGGVFFSDSTFKMVWMKTQNDGLGIYLFQMVTPFDYAKFEKENAGHPE
jgi:hypothetical protein